MHGATQHTHSHEINDFRGTPILEGCNVVYPRRVGSAMWMVEGTVTAVHHDHERDEYSLEIERKRESGSYAAGMAPNVTSFATTKRSVRISPTRVTVVQ